mmetsp:Transcript_68794/g.109220  ORF Transcript_68794/g.109220 Transcript_68794/m.109220 type:complete len:511 (+) Transcript_68794:59-1591(+)
MTALPDAIRFRALAKDLNSKEFEKYLKLLVSVCGRDELLRVLFADFAKSANNEMVHKSIDIIDELIKSRRKSTRNSRTATTKQSIDQLLPSAVIGKISSYLQFTDNVSFSRANRDIYIGCNTPNKLQQLDLTHFDIDTYDYCSIPPLIKYPDIKRLEISINKFKELKWPKPAAGQFAFNQLEELSLDAEEDVDIDLENFRIDDIVNGAAIKRLKLVNFDSGAEMFAVDVFFGILRKFPNLEYLELMHAFTEEMTVNEKSTLQRLLPKLKGVVFNGCTEQNAHHFLQMFASNLVSISLNLDTIPMVSFDAMQEVCLYEAAGSHIAAILRATSNLKRFRLCDIEHCDEAVLTSAEFVAVLKDVLCTQHALEYLDVDGYPLSYFNDVCNGVESGLYRARKTRKSQSLNVRIALRMETDALDQASLILLPLLRIANQMRSMTQDFIVQLEICKGVKVKFDVDDWNRECDALQQYDLSMWKWNDGKTFCVVLSNHQCKLSGKYASWIMLPRHDSL